MQFDLSYHGEKLSIRVVELSQLKFHERTILAEVEGLKAKIIGDGVLRDPLVVDRHSRVVLDGMHRAAALRALGATMAVCCLVNYDDPSIRLESWYRIIESRNTSVLSWLEAVRTRLNLTWIPRKEQEPLSSLHGLRLISREAYADLSSIGEHPSRTFERLDEFEREISRLDLRIQFATKRKAFEALEGHNADLILALPLVSKDDVRRNALQKRLYPHKTTRHIIPGRPLAVNFPVAKLTDTDISTDTANRLLYDWLVSRKTAQRPPGSVIEGREYEEEVLLLEAG